MGSHSRNYSRQESHDEESEEICVSALSCHLQKALQFLSCLSQSCFGRRGHIQKLYCWYPELGVLRGMIHQTMNSPVSRAFNQLFLLCFVNVCICLLTPMLSYQGLSREEQCLNVWKNQTFNVNALDFDNTCQVAGFPPLRWGCFQHPSTMEEGVTWAGGKGRAPCWKSLQFSHPAIIGLKQNPVTLELHRLLEIIQLNLLLLPMRKQVTHIWKYSRTFPNQRGNQQQC